MVPFHRRRKRAQALPLVAGQQRLDARAQSRVADLGDEEVEKPLQLVGVAAARRCERRRVDAGRRLERAHLNLQLVAEALDPPQHAYGLAFREAGVEQIDVVPDACLHATAPVCQLEREVGSPGPRAQPLLASNGVDALDGAVRY
ncbi:MAG: hypothetical protein ABSC36_01230 [Gaiellaceae bacterium]